MSNPTGISACGIAFSVFSLRFSNCPYDTVDFKWKSFLII